MNNQHIIDGKASQLSAGLALSTCLILSLFYVSSLYIWGQKHNRNHPSTVKKRFFSVTIVMLVSPAIVYLVLPTNAYNSEPIWSLIGFKMRGLQTAITLPLLLTAILFLGPLATQYVTGIWRHYLQPMYWLNNFKNILWIRNHIVAPLSEEFTFRACMMPLLLQAFRPMTAVLITSIFFGIGHLHHVIERLRSNLDRKTVFILSTFQLCYTTIFGSYSAFLFVRTGHFMAPFVAHAFCNHMGFPDVQEVINLTGCKRIVLICCYVLGFVSWIVLLPILTEPTWYHNDLYWSNEE